MSQARLLVVDDDPLNLEIIAEYLEGEGYALITADSGKGAMRLLDATDAQFDAVLLDRMMPGMSGIDVLKLMKADFRWLRLPVIMQTAAAEPELVREGLLAGAYYYLTKPYDAVTLRTIVSAALSDARERAAIAERLRPHPDALKLMDQAEFRFASIHDAQQLTGLLALTCPQPDQAALGLAELLINAVEHGNLGISYAEKKQIKIDGLWAAEVARRLTLPEYSARTVSVRVRRLSDEVEFTIEDQGAGFDWAAYAEFDPQRAFDPNGRGIALARRFSFTRLEYSGCGNVVVATVAGAPRETAPPDGKD